MVGPDRQLFELSGPQSAGRGVHRHRLLLFWPVELPTNIVCMFVALSVLHKGSWTHGNSRTKNFVLDSEAVFPINFEHSCSFNGDAVANSAAVKGYIFQLAASILGHCGSSDLEQDMLSLLYSCSAVFYKELCCAFAPVMQKATLLSLLNR